MQPLPMPARVWVSAAGRRTDGCGCDATQRGRCQLDRCRALQYRRLPARPSRSWVSRKCAAESRCQAAHGARSSRARRPDRMQNVDAREGGTVTVRDPAAKGEDAARPRTMRFAGCGRGCALPRFGRSGFGSRFALEPRELDLSELLMRSLRRCAELTGRAGTAESRQRGIPRWRRHFEHTMRSNWT